MAKYIINLPVRNRIDVVESATDPTSVNGDQITYSTVEEHHYCDACFTDVQDKLIPDGKTCVMVGIDVDTSGVLCEKCGVNTATKYVKKFLR